MKTTKLTAFLTAALIAVSSLIGCSGGDEPTGYSDPKYYTFRDYTPQLPETWNSHTYRNENASLILSYIGIGLYSFDFSEDDPQFGYRVTPEMADGMPVDVTGEYCGQYGVPEDASLGYAYRIALNQAAVWDDGTPINADTYIYSMEQLLSPELHNYRADSYYSGSLVIHGAQKYALGEADFDAVGLKKSGEYELTLILDRPLSGFELYYSLSDNWIVKEELYEAGKTEDGDSTYCTSVESTASYGPYKLTSIDGGGIVLERNLKWYGYEDGEHLGRYQADRIVTSLIAGDSDQLERFLSGGLDTVVLPNDQILNYRDTAHISYTPSSVTASLYMNADLSSLQARETDGICKAVLSLGEFRAALAKSVDRDELVTETASASSVGYGMINSVYIADTDGMLTYRESEHGKRAICEAYGVEWGEGKKYATLDEAYEKLVAYDSAGAKELFDQAYGKAIADGIMTEDDRVVLTYTAYDDTEEARRMFKYLRKTWENAVRDTMFEGKLTLEFSCVPDPVAAFRAGECDLVIVSRSGSRMDPFYFSATFASDKYTVTPAFDLSCGLTVELSRGELTASVSRLYAILMGEECELGVIDGLDDRLRILSAIEGEYLSSHMAVPIFYGNDASLTSVRINRYTDEYNRLLGRGGIEYLTFNYDDAEWEAFVSSSGGAPLYR